MLRLRQNKCTAYRTEGELNLFLSLILALQDINHLQNELKSKLYPEESVSSWASSLTTIQATVMTRLRAFQPPEEPQGRILNGRLLGTDRIDPARRRIEAAWWNRQRGSCADAQLVARPAFQLFGHNTRTQKSTNTQKCKNTRKSRIYTKIHKCTEEYKYRKSNYSWNWSLPRLSSMRRICLV